MGEDSEDNTWSYLSVMLLRPRFVGQYFSQAPQCRLKCYLFFLIKPVSLFLEHKKNRSVEKLNTSKNNYRGKNPVLHYLMQ